MSSQLPDRDQYKDLSNMRAFSSPEVIEIGKEAEENHFEDLAQHRDNCRLVSLWLDDRGLITSVENSHYLLC